MSVRRERSASMRTLKRSLTGTSGPDTALFRAGLDSSRTACAAAGTSINRAAAAANRMSAQRFRRPGCMTLLLPRAVKSSVKVGLTAGRKLYRSRRGLLFHLGAGVQTGLPPRPAEEPRKSAGAAGRRQSRLLLRIDLVAVVPINRRVGSGIVSNFSGGGLVELALGALLFLHFALLDALHFFLPFLKCCGHKLSLQQSAARALAPAVQPIHENENYQRGSRGCRADSR